MCTAPNFDELRVSYYESKFHPKLTQLLRHFESNGKKFLNGELSYPDFIFFEILSYIKKLYPNKYNSHFSAFEEWFTNFTSIEEIKVIGSKSKNILEILIIILLNKVCFGTIEQYVLLTSWKIQIHPR